MACSCLLTLDGVRQCFLRAIRAAQFIGCTVLPGVPTHGHGEALSPLLLASLYVGVIASLGADTMSLTQLVVGGGFPVDCRAGGVLGTRRTCSRECLVDLLLDLTARVVVHDRPEIG